MSQVQILSARPEPLETLGFQGLIFSVENNPHTNACKRRGTSMPDSHEFALAEGSDRVGHVVQSFRPERRVGVQCDAGRGVAELHLHGLHVRALGDREARVCVAQTVYGHAFILHAGRFDGLVPYPCPPRVRPDVPATGGTEQPVVITHAIHLHLDLRHEEPWYRDVAGLSVLRGAEHAAAVPVVSPCTAYPGAPPVRVHVTDLKGKRFAYAASRIGLPSGPQTVHRLPDLFRLVREQLDLADREEHHVVVGGDLRHGDPVHRILTDPPVRDGVVRDAYEDDFHAGPFNGAGGDCGAGCC